MIKKGFNSFADFLAGQTHVKAWEKMQRKEIEIDYANLSGYGIIYIILTDFEILQTSRRTSFARLV